MQQNNQFLISQKSNISEVTQVIPTTQTTSQLLEKLCDLHAVSKMSDISHYNAKYSDSLPEDFKFFNAKSKKIDEIILEVLNRYAGLEDFFKQQKDISLHTDLVSRIITVCAKRNSRISMIKRMQNHVSKFCQQQNIHQITPLEEINRGKSGCQSFDTTKGKYYIKPFLYSEDEDVTGIDPREAFAYKALEYLNFGPKTVFSFGSDSTFEGASIKTSCFIITEGLEILLDDTQGKELFDKLQNSTKKKDAIELSCFSLIRNLLSLGDVFPNNRTNYGITQNLNLKFIDHLPGKCTFDFMSQDKCATYSPRADISKVCSGKDYRGNLGKINYTSFAAKILAKDVNHALFQSENNIHNAVTKAKQDIESLIKFNGEYFIYDAEKVMEDHLDKIHKSISNYQKTNYSQEKSSSQSL